MDQNAAQIAARNIKTAKGRRRPIQSTPNAPQSMSFGGGGGGAPVGGGLFGGGLQVQEGGFNFSAPSGGISFPPSPFGGSNAFGAPSSGTAESERDVGQGGDEDRRKKSFRGPEGPSTSTPVQSNLFGSQQANPFTSVDNPFNFSPNASQPSSPGLGGFSAPTKPAANNIFPFGGTQSQPASAPPSNIFNSGPSQDKPASNPFGFGQPTPQPARQNTSPFAFGSSAPLATQDKPVNTPFSFSQSSTRPSSPGLFSSAPAAQAPTSNVFGSFQSPSSTPATQAPSSNMFAAFQPPSSTPAAQVSTSNFFGASQPASFAPVAEKSSTNMFETSQPTQSTSTAPSNNPFAHLNSSTAPSNNLFSGQQESKSSATPNNPFGGQTPQPSTTSNVFGTLNQTHAKSIPFGEQKPEMPSSSLFSGLNKPAESTSNVFGSPKPAPTSTLFGGTPAASTSDMFGNLNKPVDQPGPESNANGTPAVSTSNIFGNLNKPVEQPASQSKSNGTPGPSANDPFGNLNKPVDQAAPKSKDNSNSVDGTSGEAQTGESSSLSLFNKTPSTNLFGGLPQAKPTGTGSGPTFSFGNSQPTSSTAHANNKSSSMFPFGSSQASSLPPQTNGKTPSSPMKPLDAPSSASQPPPSGMFPNLPPSTPPKQNEGLNKMPASTALTTTEDPSSALVNGHATGNIDFDALYAEMDAASATSDEQLSSMVPARFSQTQKNEFYTAYRLRSLNKAVEKFFGSVTFSMSISNLVAFYNEKKVEILDRSSLPIPGSKRKCVDGNDQLNRKSTDDEDPEEHRNKRSRQDAAPKSNMSQPSPTAPSSKHSKPSDDEDQENENPTKRSRQSVPSTSHLFQAQPQPPSAKSPEKSMRDQDQLPSYLNGTVPKTPSFAPSPSFSAPTVSPSTAPPAPPPTKGKRKAEVQLTKLDHERAEHEGRRMKTPLKPQNNGDSDADGSTTSNIFKSIVDSPSKAREKVAPLKAAASPSKNDAPKLNPFGGLPVPQSPTKPATSPAAPPGRFVYTPPPNATTSSVFTSMPTFTPPKSSLGGANMMAQFAEAAAATERKLMEDAKAEDMDSEDDEEEWEANYKAKKEADKKEFEKLSLTGKKFEFKATKSNSTNSSTSGSSSGSINQTVGSQSATATTTLFGQPMQSSGNSVFGSRASTPGGFGSSTGSVLDGYTPGQSLSLGTNMFAHLSDVDSGPDSGQADEDSPSVSDEENDSENKDPNYDPSQDSGSGPGTPVEETGAGLASAKKKTSTTPFAASSSTLGGGLDGDSRSGTNTPSRSMFDRVTLDSNGNPMRQLPTENQENTPPPAATTNTSSVFAALSSSTPPPTATTNFTSIFSGLSSTSPANQTWNPATPILFANTTPTPNITSNPTVSITEATPTKASRSNLFGNLNTPASTPGSPFSSLGLFGSNSNALVSSAPTSGSVSFNFGGQPSATSSLFPSAAVSTTTSRATSPGNTTDGDSAAEEADTANEPKLDLTSGGPGTEDEDMIYEAKAKATKFIPKDGETSALWKAMGLGPLRLYKHKETGATRVVLRADPRGAIVLNKSLLAKVDYKADKKTVKLLAASDEGEGFETWILQVKTAEMAEELAKLMESNRPSE